MELPMVKTKAATKSPKRLVIYSQYKAGKTSLIAGLENTLIVDTEDGSDYVEGMIVKVKTYQDIHDLCMKVKEAGKPYRYIAVDTITSLEDIAKPLALKLYQLTPMGKAYTGDILSLPNGGGYLYFRNAVDLLIEKLSEACERLILLGHVKEKIVEKAGKEVSAKEIDLTGKVRFNVCSKADAIGFLYREGANTMISFETSEEIACGARPAHLRGKKLVMGTYDEKEDKLTTYWSKIYID